MERRSVLPDALSYLGLARRAGAVAPGVDAARRAVNAGKARLIVLASDAARGQAKKVVRSAVAAGVPVVCGPDRNTVGRAIGRAGVSAVAVTDDNFAREIGSRLPSADGGEEGPAGRGR